MPGTTKKHRIQLADPQGGRSPTAGAAGRQDKGRWFSRRKSEVVRRILRGETRKDFIGAFEIAFYGWREDATHLYLGPNNATDLWHVKKVASLYICSRGEVVACFQQIPRLDRRARQGVTDAGQSCPSSRRKRLAIVVTVLHPRRPATPDRSAMAFGTCNDDERIR